MPERNIPFSRRSRATGEDAAIADALASGTLVGGGPETRRVQALLEAMTGCRRALLTSSGTSALELACLLADLGPGDEVIVPSFTFSSCANAIALRGAVPVFVDIRPDTFNIDEALVEAAITPRTRAIMPVDYAGIAPDMDAIAEIAGRHGLLVIEDAAQGVGARFRDRALGTLGTFGAFSFHGTKNIGCGEGGALLINDARFVERAEILWEKGTNRSLFLRGEVDKYTWVDIGSSFIASDLSAALLRCQLADLDAITGRRRAVWDRYHARLARLESLGLIRRPIVPQDCEPNAHIYAILLPDAPGRDSALTALKSRGVHATFHYVPLHSAPAGLRLGRSVGSLDVTDDCASRLLRLPLHADLSTDDQDYVIAMLENVLLESAPDRSQPALM